MPEESTVPSSAGRGATALRERARSIAAGMRKVELAETEYARRQRQTDQPRTRTKSRSSWMDRGSIELIFALADAVDELCSAWQLFRVLAAAEGLTWQKALQGTLPVLFRTVGDQATQLRQDTTFSYVVVRSEEDVMKCFTWRFERGYC